jgi:hypothetical protein
MSVPGIKKYRVFSPDFLHNLTHEPALKRDDDSVKTNLVFLNR